MICEIWSWPVFEILSILDIDPEFLILEPASFRGTPRYTKLSIYCCSKKNVWIYKNTRFFWWRTSVFVVYWLAHPTMNLAKGPWLKSRCGYSEKNGSLKYLVQAWFVVLRGPNITPHQEISWSSTFNFIALKKEGCKLSNINYDIC